MTEGDFIRKLTDELNKRDGVKAIKLHTGPYGRKGEPDILGCFNGRMFAIEGKLAYNKPTTLQVQRIGEWRAAGACAGVVTHHARISIPNTVDSILNAVTQGVTDYEQGTVY